MTKYQEEHDMVLREHANKLKSWEEVLKDRALKDRREHIATAALQGMLAGLYADTNVTVISHGEVARKALAAADALIAELDKETA